MQTEILILILLFGGISYFVFTGIELFSKGWSSYENKVLQGAEQTLDAMYLTIPAQHITYLSLACFFFFSLLIFIVSGSWAGALIIGTLSLGFPILLLRKLKANRDKTFGIQLVPALSNMGNALKAGMSLNQSIDMIHSEMDGPIAQEFRLLSHELHFGENLSEALKNLEKRMPNQDLSLVVTAINISMDVGGNLSDIFDNIATTIRERQTLEAKVKSLTAQGKMQGTVMCMIPIGLLSILTTLYPEMMAPLYESNEGIFTLIFCAFMLVAGWFSIAKLTQIDF
jgi:tight adherence protein B